MKVEMRPGQVDKYLDKTIDLMTKLGYTDGRAVKDKVRIGITPELRNVWATKTPHPDDINLYIDILRQTGHDLEDTHRFSKTVGKDKTSSHDKGEERSSSSKRNKRKERGSGKQTSRPANSSAARQPRQGNSEYAEAHKNIPTNLLDKRRKLSQCTKCGQPGHNWRKCASSSPVVAVMSKKKTKRTAAVAGHTSGKPVFKVVKSIVVPPSAPRKLLEVRASSPQIMEVDTDASD